MKRHPELVAFAAELFEEARGVWSWPSLSRGSWGIERNMNIGRETETAEVALNS